MDLKFIVFVTNISISISNAQVEERSLRNRFLKGTAVRSPPKEASFQTRQFLKMFRTKFDGNPISDGFFQSRNLGRSAVTAIYYCMKRNVALEIGPMTSS